MLMRFFTGMSVTGYVIAGLIAAILLSWSAMFFMGKRISSLHEDIGAYEVTVNNLVSANLSTRDSLDQVEELLQQCLQKRANAENKADIARQELAKKQREAYRASDERRDSIEEDIDTSNPECVPSSLSPRATELLIESARSANRGTDSP